MKTKLLILFASLFVFLITNNVYSTCPDGFTNASFTVTIPPSYCEYTVYYCYKCVMPAPPVGLIVDHYYKNNENCQESLSSEDVKVYIENYLFEHFFAFSICELPPCDEDYIVLQFSYSKCWYKENDNGRIIYHNCNTYYCCVNSHWCWENGKAKQIGGAGIPYWCKQEGDDCTDSEPGNPESGHSTGCFHFDTPCH